MTSSRTFIRSIIEGYQSFFSNILRFFAATVLIAVTAAIIAIPLWFLAIQHTALYSRILIGATLAWLAYRGVRRKTLPRLLLRGIQIGGILFAAYTAAIAFIYGALVMGILFTFIALLLFGLLIRRKSGRA